MAWLRLYDTILDDPKIQMLSDRAFRMLINLWCLAKRRGGFIPDDMGVLMFALRWPETRIRDTMALLIGAHLVERVDGGYEPHDWADHQYAGDSDAERMQRYRQRKKERNALRNGLRNGQRNSDVPEQNRTEQITPQPPNGNAATRSKPLAEPEGFAEFYQAYPKHEGRGHALKAYRSALKKASSAELLSAASAYRKKRTGQDSQYTPLPASWLNGERWHDEAPSSAAEFEPTDEHGWRNRLESFKKYQVWPAKWGGAKPGDDPRHPPFLRGAE